jgi:hypothetical protein
VRATRPRTCGSKTGSSAPRWVSSALASSYFLL